MCNSDIKNEVKQSGVYLWQIADRLGINDGNFSRKLRKELSEAEKERIRSIIKDLKAERKEYEKNE